MESRSNVLSTVSLVCSIALIVCYFGGMCIGMLPFVGILALFLMPVEWILAIVGLITGIIGFRQSSTMDGVGAVPGIVGALVSGLWLLLQIVVWGLMFVVFGSMVVFSMIAVILDSM